MMTCLWNRDSERKPALSYCMTLTTFSVLHRNGRILLSISTQGQCPMAPPHETGAQTHDQCGYHLVRIPSVASTGRRRVSSVSRSSDPSSLISSSPLLQHSLSRTGLLRTSRQCWIRTCTGCTPSSPSSTKPRLPFRPSPNPLSAWPWSPASHRHLTFPRTPATPSRFSHIHPASPPSIRCSTCRTLRSPSIRGMHGFSQDRHAGKRLSSAFIRWGHRLNPPRPRGCGVPAL